MGSRPFYHLKTAGAVKVYGGRECASTRRSAMESRMAVNRLDDFILLFLADPQGFKRLAGTTVRADQCVIVHPGKCGTARI